MAILGTGSYMFFVWVSLRELGKMIGGNDLKSQISRAVKLGILAYIAVFFVILLAAIVNPYGITGLPAVAALMLALGGMSPMLWMMQWFRADSFAKLPGEPLAIEGQWAWIVMAILSVILYSVVLGKTLYF